MQGEKEIRDKKEKGAKEEEEEHSITIICHKFKMDSNFNHDR